MPPDSGVSRPQSAQTRAHAGAKGVRFRYDGSVEEEPDPIAAAWEALEQAWGDEQAHKRFVSLCASVGRLPEAGRRYRTVRDTDPARAEMAAGQIAQLLRVAMLSLETQRATPPQRPRVVLLLVALLVTATMILAATLLLLHRA